MIIQKLCSKIRKLKNEFYLIIDGFQKKPVYYRDNFVFTLFNQINWNVSILKI